MISPVCCEPEQGKGEGELTLPAFANPALLRQALTHRSYRNEHQSETEADGAPVQDNERLEYVGDAVVDLVSALYLYERFPEVSEGELTSLRSALVKSATLAGYARILGLPNLVRLSRGEERAGGRERNTILGDVFEAVVGALFLDQGWEAARSLVLGLLFPEAERVYREQRDLDAKSVFQEFAQGNWHKTPSYRLIETRGPEHAKTFVVAVEVGGEEWGRGEGSSLHQAQQNAAKRALVCATQLPFSEETR